MKITNLHDRALTIAGPEITVEPGESVEVDDVLGESLCEQVDRWAKASPPKPTKSKASAADESEED